MIDWILDRLEPLDWIGCWIAMVVFGLVFVLGGASLSLLFR